MIKAVVFDLDGTLLDTLYDLKNALNYTLEHYGYKSVSLLQTRNYIGNGIRMLIKRACDANEELLDEMFNYFKEYYKNHYNDETIPYDGINELLAYLKNTNLLLGVISNKASYALHPLVNAHFPNTFKEVIGDGEGFKRKPEPEVIYEICRRFNIQPNEMIYIGDGIVDYNTIKNSGCNGMIVSYGFKNKDELINGGVDKVYDTPYDILKSLEEIL